MKQSDFKYRWFVVGDVNGFFGLMFDNLTVLSFLAGILIFVFKYPANIVYGRMFPGTALGVLFGDLVYTWMAFRLAKRTNNPKVTAMPLGLRYSFNNRNCTYGFRARIYVFETAGNGC